MQQPDCQVMESETDANANKNLMKGKQTKKT